MSCILDTNVWLYALLEGQDARKSAVAKGLIKTEELMLSVQIINETCVNLIRKGKFPEGEIRELVVAFHERYPVLTQSSMSLVAASELREEYSLSFWDSLIISTALHAGVPIVYSEDMHDGLIVRGNLKIINPFATEELINQSSRHTGPA